jgi:2-C-methyl-D-erythritol 2,4-cyclodiphosphate synthase
MRIGQGVDFHAFCDGSSIVLGGVRIEHERGIAAHSDGDVLIHALCDAILGALAEGDIGHHFPPGDPRWKGADSRSLLREVARRMRARDFALLNADCTMICERPRIAPHAAAMRERLAADLGVSVAQISIKATTSEGMGFTGRGEGIAALATVLLAPTSTT